MGNILTLILKNIPALHKWLTNYFNAAYAELEKSLVTETRLNNDLQEKLAIANNEANRFKAQAEATRLANADLTEKLSKSVAREVELGRILDDAKTIIDNLPDSGIIRMPLGYSSESAIR